MARSGGSGREGVVARKWSGGRETVCINSSEALSCGCVGPGPALLFGASSGMGEKSLVAPRCPITHPNLLPGRLLALSTSPAQSPEERGGGSAWWEAERCFCGPRLLRERRREEHSERRRDETGRAELREERKGSWLAVEIVEDGTQEMLLSFLFPRAHHDPRTDANDC